MAQIVLSIINPENYIPDIVRIIKKNKSNGIIYVTTNKPYDHISELLKNNKIDTKKIFFVDCISKNVQEKEVSAKNCIFVESPGSLSAISIAVNEAVKNISGKKILLFDSLSVLLIYQDAATIAKFTNFLMNKLRVLDVDAIILALESDANKDVLKQIESFADKVTKGVK
jgi:KaiC/GvpD/RAD55 family RecA-like ATPase